MHGRQGTNSHAWPFARESEWIQEGPWISGISRKSKSRPIAICVWRPRNKTQIQMRTNLWNRGRRKCENENRCELLPQKREWRTRNLCDDAGRTFIYWCTCLDARNRQFQYELHGCHVETGNAYGGFVINWRNHMFINCNGWYMGQLDKWDDAQICIACTLFETSRGRPSARGHARCQVDCK